MAKLGNNNGLKDLKAENVRFKEKHQHPYYSTHL